MTRLMSGQGQKNRPEPGVLAFPVEGRSDAPKITERSLELLGFRMKATTSPLGCTSQQAEARTRLRSLEHWRTWIIRALSSHSDTERTFCGRL